MGMGIPASTLSQPFHYPHFPEFAQYGIDLSLVDAELIHVIERLRTLTGIPITPSPVQGAWGRTSGSETSRHYAVGRLSDAGDIFPARGRVLDLWLAAQAIPEIGGIGLYADTRGPDGQPWPMMHIDLRSYRVSWACDTVSGSRAYYYLPHQPRQFWAIVGRIIIEEGST